MPQDNKCIFPSRRFQRGHHRLPRNNRINEVKRWGGHPVRVASVAFRTYRLARPSRGCSFVERKVIQPAFRSDSEINYRRRCRNELQRGRGHNIQWWLVIDEPWRSFLVIESKIQRIVMANGFKDSGFMNTDWNLEMFKVSDKLVVQ